MSNLTIESATNERATVYFTNTTGSAGQYYALLNSDNGTVLNNLNLYSDRQATIATDAGIDLLVTNVSFTLTWKMPTVGAPGSSWIRRSPPCTSRSPASSTVPSTSCLSRSRVSRSIAPNGCCPTKSSCAAPPGAVGCQVPPHRQASSVSYHLFRCGRRGRSQYRCSERWSHRREPSWQPSNSKASTRSTKRVSRDPRSDSRDRRRGVPGARRPLGLRQVDGAAHDRRAGDDLGGTMMIGDRVVNDVQPKDRDIAMVFQNYALYPHMTVYDNIGFALKLRRCPRRRSTQRVRKAAAILELDEYLDRKPGQLSGGQRQRVAMGRAIVRQPAAFLMDEPLSNLDAKLRVQMRAEIAALQRELGVTTVYVTHDQIEAMTMGDRVAVIKDGYLQQVDTPQQLYDQPDNVFVAAFIGSPSMNLFEATFTGSDDVGTLSSSACTCSVCRRMSCQAPRLAGLRRQADRSRHPSRGLRRCCVRRAPGGPAASQCKVTLTEAFGSEIMVHFESMPRRSTRATPTRSREDRPTRRGRPVQPAVAGADGRDGRDRRAGREPALLRPRHPPGDLGLNAGPSSWWEADGHGPGGAAAVSSGSSWPGHRVNVPSVRRSVGGGPGPRCRAATSGGLHARVAHTPPLLGVLHD